MKLLLVTFLVSIAFGSQAENVISHRESWSPSVPYDSHTRAEEKIDPVFRPPAPVSQGLISPKFTPPTPITKSTETARPRSSTPSFDRDAFAKHVSECKFLNEDGKEGAPKIDGKVAGVGVVLASKATETGFNSNVCTVTHTSKNEAVTAAHCLADENAVNSFRYFDSGETARLAFFDRKNITIEASKDLARIRLPDDLAKNWPTLPSKSGEAAEASTSATVLSFDSFQDTPPDNIAYRGQCGWTFHKKRVLLTSRAPEGFYDAVKGSAVTVNRLFLNPDPDHRESYSRLRTTNSGSVIVSGPENNMRIYGLFNEIISDLRGGYLYGTGVPL